MTGHHAEQTKMAKDRKPQKRPEGGAGDGPPGKEGRKTKNVPPAGPHADPRLQNPDATPGTGALPSVGEDEDPNMGSTG
ncbi:hypothetical protein N177_0433 [Lutibaculum baratangense AMV1]|uniref:Uncharacterized protein n=1 Tax=Lutibaculum baratangense AMV1 TaxID=631454 RepID=V4R4Y2_9HYPH|nr:hypothetical protein N177_0433 [Lutibaculum baratangense AMV1]